MHVLLSIRPEFASQILAGTKKYEYRRTLFRCDSGQKVIMYASRPICGLVGEFEVGSVLAGEPRKIWAETGAQGGISRRRFLDYFADAVFAYAIQVAQVRRYRRAYDLADHLGVSAPQSFRYLRAVPKLPLAECR